jgi:hypothetical protein
METQNGIRVWKLRLPIRRCCGLPPARRGFQENYNASRLSGRRALEKRSNAPKFIRTVKREVAARSPSFRRRACRSPPPPICILVPQRQPKRPTSPYAYTLGYTSPTGVPKKLSSRTIAPNSLVAPASTTAPTEPVGAGSGAVATLGATWVGVKEGRQRSLRHRFISRPNRLAPARDRIRVTSKKRSTRNARPCSGRKQEQI